MIADYAIREKIAQYLTDGISLDKFEDWLVEQSWDMHTRSDEQSQRLASAIELRLAEHSSGHLSEAALRYELLAFVTKYFIDVLLNNNVFQQSSRCVSLSSANERLSVAFQVAFPVPAVPQPADTSLVAGHA